MSPASNFVAHFEARFPNRDLWRPGCAYSAEGEKLAPFVFEEPPGDRIGVFSILATNPNTVQLCLIRADVCCRRDGPRMLAALCAEADRLAVSMKLQAVPADDRPDPIPEDKLVAFYRKFGFVELGGMVHKPYMIRAPTPPRSQG
jgi:hypothetical protein